jgi:hypothetical protein
VICKRENKYVRLLSSKIEKNLLYVAVGSDYGSVWLGCDCGKKKVDVSCEKSCCEDMSY